MVSLCITITAVNIIKLFKKSAVNIIHSYTPVI